jgi:hypothetical protein
MAYESNPTVGNRAADAIRNKSITNEGLISRGKFIKDDTNSFGNLPFNQPVRVPDYIENNYSSSLATPKSTSYGVLASDQNTNKPLINFDPTGGNQQGLTFDQYKSLMDSQKLSPFSQGMQNFGLAAQGASSLYNMYNAHKSRKLAERQAGTELASYNRSLANDTLSYNQDLMERTRNGLLLNSVAEGSPEWQRRMAQANASKVDGSAIT